MTSSEKKDILDRGFSLIEVVVALGVFSLALMSLLQLNTQNTRSTVRLHEQTLARFVAHNEMVRAVDELDRVRGSVDKEELMLGYTFEVTRDVEVTSVAGLERIDVSVVMKNETQVLATLTGFRRSDR